MRRARPCAAPTSARACWSAATTASGSPPRRPRPSPSPARASPRSAARSAPACSSRSARTTCPLGEVAQVVQYLAGESAGQCGPCRLGLPDLARAVAAGRRWAAARWRTCGRRPAWSRAAARAATRTAPPGSPCPRSRSSPRRRGARQRRGLRQAGTRHPPAARTRPSRAPGGWPWTGRAATGTGSARPSRPEIIRLDAQRVPGVPADPAAAVAGERRPQGGQRLPGAGAAPDRRDPG